MCSLAYMQYIDIIRDTATKNFLYEYNGVVGGGSIITYQVVNGENTFASTYASQVTSTNAKLKAMVEELEAEKNA